MTVFVRTALKCERLISQLQEYFKTNVTFCCDKNLDYLKRYNFNLLKSSCNSKSTPKGKRRGTFTETERFVRRCFGSRKNITARSCVKPYKAGEKKKVLTLL